MNFARSHRDTIPGNLILNKANPDGSVSTSSVTFYKYLGDIFDPMLHWHFQHAKAHTLATFWSLQIWYLLKLVINGIKPGEARQLYTTVSVPSFM